MERQRGENFGGERSSLKMTLLLACLAAPLILGVLLFATGGFGSPRMCSWRATALAVGGCGARGTALFPL